MNNVKRGRRALTRTEPVTCAGCGRSIPITERVYRTRGLMRHNGSWVGECCAA